MGRSKMYKILFLGEKFTEKFMDYEIKNNKSDLMFNNIMVCFQNCNISKLIVQYILIMHLDLCFGVDTLQFGLPLKGATIHLDDPFHLSLML